MDLFTRSWDALLATVAALPDDHFERPSGCAGWLIRDLVCHLIIDAQDVLITLASPADTDPTVDATSYWHLSDQQPTGQDPLDALTVRLAAAYEQPELMRFHLDDVGSGAGRAAVLADPDTPVSTRGEVLTVNDYLTAYVLEWTLHHLDVSMHLPPADDPPRECLAHSRRALETLAGTSFPDSFSDQDVLLVGTGRRPANDQERTALGTVDVQLPLVLS